MVVDLVDVARQRIDHLDITHVNVDVSEFVRSAVSQVPEIERFDVRLDIGGVVDLTTDRDRMLQIVTNFLSNAAKYGSSRVEIVVFDPSGDTVIEVHDDGPGVPDMYHMVIWERFERGAQRQSPYPDPGLACRCQGHRSVPRQRYSLPAIRAARRLLLLGASSRAAVGRATSDTTQCEHVGIGRGRAG